MHVYLCTHIQRDVFLKEDLEELTEPQQSVAIAIVLSNDLSHLHARARMRTPLAAAVVCGDACPHASDVCVHHYGGLPARS